MNDNDRIRGRCFWYSQGGALGEEELEDVSRIISSFYLSPCLLIVWCGVASQNLFHHQVLCKVQYIRSYQAKLFILNYLRYSTTRKKIKCSSNYFNHIKSYDLEYLYIFTYVYRVDSSMHNYQRPIVCMHRQYTQFFGIHDNQVWCSHKVVLGLFDLHKTNTHFT